MTAVLEHAEKAGKEVHPVIVPTNRPLDTILRTAQSLHVQELVLGTTQSLDTVENFGARSGIGHQNGGFTESQPPGER